MTNLSQAHAQAMEMKSAERVEARRGVGPSPGAAFKSLLHMCEYPPSTLAGAPVIAKQLFRTYDLSKLHVLCCQHQVDKVSDLVQDSFLDCDHTMVPAYAQARLRPRRIFNPIKETINCLRTSRIVREARRIVERKQVEAIFTIPWRCEFALAAYQMHRETSLPLYVFETDDWEAMNPRLLQGYRTRTNHAPLLRAAEQLWVTSPNMQRIYRDRFGVVSDFLFHFVDLEKYLAVSAELEDQRAPSKIQMVYTGSINRMFYDTMKYVCDMLNRGVHINGCPVQMAIYGPGCPDEFLGENVVFKGLVDLGEIPHVLGAADLTFVGVTFSQQPEIKKLVQTSLYTKTIDYLASGRPVLVISPPYSGEVDYFGEVTTVVGELDEEAIRAAIAKMIFDEDYAQQIRAKGIDLVRSRHSMASIDALFLNHFRKQS